MYAFEKKFALFCDLVSGMTGDGSWVVGADGPCSRDVVGHDPMDWGGDGSSGGDGDGSGGVEGNGRGSVAGHHPGDVDYGRLCRRTGLSPGDLDELLEKELGMDGREILYSFQKLLDLSLPARGRGPTGNI